MSVKTKSRLYACWRSMKKRCYLKSCPEYHLYGARGISICKDWLNNFEVFKTWALKNGYKENLTLDRIDNNGNYTPENCRWITNLEQQRNKRNNIIINGLALSKFCEIHDLPYNCIESRRSKYKENTITAIKYYINKGYGINLQNITLKEGE